MYEVNSSMVFRLMGTLTEECPPFPIVTFVTSTRVRKHMFRRQIIDLIGAP